MKIVVSVLQLCQIKYQWGFPFKLVINLNNQKILIKNKQEGEAFCRNWGRYLKIALSGSFFNKMALRISLLLLNVVGLGNFIKRRQLRRMLMADKVDILCLQEMHVQNSDIRCLWEMYSGNIWHSGVLMHS